MLNKTIQKLKAFYKKRKKLSILLILCLMVITFFTGNFLLNNKLVVTPEGKLLGFTQSVSNNKNKGVQDLEISPETAISLDETTIAIPANNYVLEVDILTGKVKTKHQLDYEIYALLDLTQDKVVKYVSLINYGYWYMENNEPKRLLLQYNQSPNFLNEKMNKTDDFSFGITYINYIKETAILNFVSQLDTIILDLNTGEIKIKYEHFPEGRSSTPFANKNKGRNISKDGNTTLSSRNLYSNDSNEPTVVLFPRSSDEKIRPELSYFSENDKSENTIYTKMYFGGGLYKTNLQTKESIQILTEEQIQKLGLVGKYIANINGDLLSEIKYKESVATIYDDSGMSQRGLNQDKILATPEKTYLISIGKQSKNIYLIDLRNGKFLRSVRIND
jgi:hypothetical protein